MASPQPCPHCGVSTLMAIDARMMTVRADIDVLTRARAVDAVLAGRVLVHLRDGHLRPGPDLTYPVLAVHACAQPANAEEARALAVLRERGFTPLGETPPF